MGPGCATNASRDRNRGYESIVTEILAEAGRVDREEDERYGQARGDELPEPLRTREGRRAALAAARDRIERERAAVVEAGEEVIERIELGLDRDRFPGSPDGREAWLRQGRRELEARREREALPIPQGRGERLVEARRRLDQQLAYEHSANREYEQYRATAVDRLGRRLSNYNRSNPYRPPLVPEGKINVTDPDSREMRTQGSAEHSGVQRAGGRDRAADRDRGGDHDAVTRFRAARTDGQRRGRELEQTGVSERPRAVLADAGYWHTKQIEKLRGDGFEVLVPPDSTVREDARPGWEGGIYDAMRQSLRTPEGRQRYLKRTTSIEPVFGQIKHNRGMTRFRRRGRAAARSEWRLISATHNLLKLHNHWIAPAAG